MCEASGRGLGLGLPNFLHGTLIGIMGSVLVRNRGRKFTDVRIVRGSGIQPRLYCVTVMPQKVEPL